MDSRLILARAVTLIYRESQLSTKSVDNSSEIIKEVVGTIKTTDNVIIDGDYSREIVSNLKTTLSWMLNNFEGASFDKTELLQRIRVNTAQDEQLYTAIEEGIIEDVEEEEARRICSHYRTEFVQFLNRRKVKEILKNWSTRVNFQEDAQDWRHLVKEVINDLEPFKDISGTTKHTSIVNDFDFNNLDTLRSAMAIAESELSTDGVMRFGIQAINRMFGRAGGLKRGEFVVIGALQHNFKSGFTLTLMKQLMMYNTPFLRDPTKKPLIMRISYENKASDDVYWLYKSLIENQTCQFVDISSVDYETAITHVADTLQASGFYLNMVQIDPSEFTYHDLFDRVNYFESQGYEIQAIFCDYLAMQSKKGCTVGAQGQDIRDLFRRVRNFMAKKGIAFVTPHQLSTEAKALVRMGADNFVQEIANKGYYDSCKTIDQEVDMEIYIHIVKSNGESYLTVQRGKHRGVNITPTKDLYTVLKFEDTGGIRDDINGRDTSRRTIGGSTIADGGGDAWFS